jgi:mannose/cellobiose epimerase-like protein (N-acyl-D-glucosamine 2-epimerase family)
MNLIKDDELENLQREHINYIMNIFYNSELSITNENLLHDYSRISGYEDYMFPGHSVETLWFVMFEALRLKDRTLFDTAVKRILHYIEIGWDYVFEGFGDLHYWVYDGDGRTREKMYGVKSMWSHAELMIATMHILEYTGDIMAQKWYERIRDYSYRVFDTEYGVWRQAVDRSGKDKKRKEVYNPKRKDNYHYSRYLILNLLSLERVIKNGGKTTPFPV